MIFIELENIYQTGPIWIHRKWTRTWKPPFSVPYQAKYYLEVKLLLMFFFVPQQENTSNENLGSLVLFVALLELFVGF